jgi:isoquinoline 1-oxidoreductase
LFESPAYSFQPDRREFFRIAGAGLVVLLVLEESRAQEPGRRRRDGSRGAPSPELGAWIHIAEDGQVTAYTGKVELGQNIRTSLTQAVAEELRLPMSAVHMVMADTGLTPFDMGTAGSRTTPTMAMQLHRASAAAREALLDLAADRWKVARAGLKVMDGAVVDPQTKQSVKFGELTRGKKLLMKISSEISVTPPANWHIAGTSVAKVDGTAFVTGKHRYASDIKRPGMLYGKILRPAAFGASLEAIDSRAAEAIAGVVVVHDGSFVGVAAANEQLAERALAAIRAEWKTTPQPSGKELFSLLRKTPDSSAHTRSTRETPGPTQATGVDEIRLEATYTVAYIAHAPLEPRAAVAEWEGNRLTVWTGTQRPFGVQREIAGAFQIPEARVRVIVPDTGSGYGGKHTGEVAVEAARLAKAAGKPVKVVWTREEEFTWAYFRPAGVIEVRSVANKDGKITVWECDNYNSGGSALRGPYDIPNQHGGFHSVRSPLRQGSYRALAATANHFARESHMDELAHALGMEPLEFRLRNLKNPRLRGVLEAAARQFGWGKAKAPIDHGFGIAGGFEKGSYVAACADVAVNRSSGRVKVVRVVTAFDCGAVVNPDHLKNQIEGATVMGLGGALFEAIEFDNGKILNPRFADYRVPRFADTPTLETVLIDRKDVASAGAGETPIVAVAPAVGNAIFSATGRRLRSLPMTGH